MIFFSQPLSAFMSLVEYSDEQETFLFSALSPPWFVFIFFILFLIQFFAMKTATQIAIYSGAVSFSIFLILSSVKINKKCSRKKQKVGNENSDSESREFCECLTHNISVIHIIINTILSFLSSFTYTYLVRKYYDIHNLFIILIASFTLATAHSTLLIPKTSEFYSVSYSNFENSQTRCFSIILLSIFLFFLFKHDIDYLGIRIILYYMLLFMFFDITILYGFVGLPRSTIHWFIEFVNRYFFGFSGCTTIIDCLIQFLRGSVSLAFCCVVLYFKNLFWSRMVCLFFSSFVTSFEINKKVAILSLIKSAVGSTFFTIFNRFLANESSSNIIEIIFIVYYSIFEFIIPYISSISCYFFVYVQFIKNHKILDYVRMIFSFISAPIIAGSLLLDGTHFVISSLLIVHSMNRSFSEPQVFGLALLIARFALYYDFELTSDLALNFLTGLFISRKFFSIIDILFMRCKLSMGFLDTDLCLMRFFLDIETVFSDFHPIIQILIYFKGLLFLPSYWFYVPAFFWSLITGSPINFLFMFHSWPQPFPPKSNLFWDYTAEKYSSNEHIIESFVYHSFVGSFKEKLFNMIKKGAFGIVDENSFFLFHRDRSIILCHIISMNSFSIDFQIRCAEFTQNTLCHSGELSIFTNINGYDLSRLDVDKSIQFIRSIYSPVAKDVTFYGYNYYPIDIHNAYVSLTPEQKSQWITYSLCFCFIKHNDSENKLLNLINESGQSLFENILNLISNINNNNTNQNANNETNQNTNNETNQNANNNTNQNANNNTNQNANNETNTDANTNRNDNHDDDSISSINSSDDDEDPSNETINYMNDNTFDEEIYERFEFNSQVIHDFLYKSYDIVNFFMKKPTTFFTDYFSRDGQTGVESFIYDAGMRSCLYMFLASSYLAPEAEEFEEVKEFLDQTEEEYEICSNSDLEKILLEFRYNKNKMSKKYENKCFFSIIKNNESNKLSFIRKSESEWNVFKIERDFLRSIWASQCCEIFGMKNLSNERLSLQEDVYHLHNLMNQISDVPMSYPAYVSNIEKSFF